VSSSRTKPSRQLGEGRPTTVSLFVEPVGYFAHYLTRFLYTLYIAVDANFKLKGKEWHLSDVELMPGWGAYVPQAAYQSHLANYVDQPEVRIQ
jgi:hypothetical protein